MTSQFKSLPLWFKKFRLASSKLFRAKKVSAFFIFGSLFLNFLSWGLFIWLAKAEQSVVILHYNAFMGIDVIADFDIQKDYFQIFIAPIGGTFIFILNLIVAYILCMQVEISEFFHGKNEYEQKKSSNKKQAGSELSQNDINMLGVYLILAGSFVLQLVVFLYTIAIIWVNQ